MRELVVPLCMLFVLATLLLPIPAVMLDFLLVGNIGFALVLLISTVYVSDPLKLSAFPSILLLATLYRLVLNVSTTRRILSGAAPGQMIEAFASIVVQGNIIVGAVIFLLITLVQFIVIAKGSERVAEVAARFTLDAMPGKQMSIDADMRSGLLSMEQARNKRQALQTESRFYGALDGTMKFVKGDAIAGICITLINLGGGILMGMFVFDLGILKSMQQFSFFTVGDGLLSQIPALMNSLAAGILVTRVTNDETQTNLATDVLSQMGQVRVVKVLIAVLALLLAFAPGLPAVPFLLLAVGLALSGIFHRTAANPVRSAAAAFNPQSLDMLLIEFQGEISQSLLNKDTFLQKIDRMRQEIFNEQGILLPPPAIRNSDQSDTNQVEFFIRGVSMCVVQRTTEENLDDVVVKELKQLVARCAVDLLDDAMTRGILRIFEATHPEQVDFVIPSIISVTGITSILRELLKERVSVRPFSVIMQAIAELGEGQNEHMQLEAVRIALKHHICSDLQLAKSTATYYQLDPAIDVELSQMNESSIEAPVLDRLIAEIAALPTATVLLSSRRSRRFLRDCCHVQGLTTPCLAFEELSDALSYSISGYVGSDIVPSVDTELVAA